MQKIPDIVKPKLKLLPVSPGVYIMKNASDKIIYIGKAKVLRNRVRSYFTGTHNDAKTIEMVSKIADLEYILTQTENQALELEANLVKKHQPKYNIQLKDDKRKPFIKITIKEPFPQVFVTRELKKDGSKYFYFGPYTDTKALRKTMRMLEWIFPIRTCTRSIPDGKPVFERACMNFQLGKCTAPCIGNISKEDYKKNVNALIQFVKGRNQEVINDLTARMKKCSDDLKFEEAAEIRDKIENVQKLNRSKNMFFTDEKNRDIIGVYQEGDKAAVAVLKILSGKLLNKEIYALNNTEGSSLHQIMEAFLKQYYASKLEELPFRIFLQVEPEDIETINKWLKNKLVIPKKGDNKTLISIAKENAFNFVEEEKLKYLRKSNRTIFPIKELKDKLGLKKLPRKMICIDISTIQGTDTVSSLVFFENGKPKKKNYRHFIMKTVKGQDDFASMEETMRRYLNKIDENEKPDVIVIDGGKGQLSKSYNILQEMKKTDIEMISLAKRVEEVFLPNNKNSIILPRNSSALRVLIKIRDEAHRFAITFHRKRRKKRTLKSELDSISGVGEQTKFTLLKKFGSVENIGKASMIELMSVRGIGERSAKIILDYLSKK
ncbi:MAG: excinuclease ABC subunit UvrC [Candidatus Cloacimonetes bacterium]|nr:excinuclease ABC subunit UvrC [Candidatus Cloacimonadota bacterium]